MGDAGRSKKRAFCYVQEMRVRRPLSSLVPFIRRRAPTRATISFTVPREA